MFTSHEHSTDTGRILVVEDEDTVRAILTLNLEDSGYEVFEAEDADAAWVLLQASAPPFDAVLLDRMLPGADGLVVLKRMKESARFANIPVIMQTSMTSTEDILEGLRAGAHYYLTKPFAPETLLAIVRSAVNDHRRQLELQREVQRAVYTLGFLEQARFSFRTPAEAQDIAALLANACPRGPKVVLGLSELMLNAVEHGNLAITYQEKSRLIAESRLREEIEVRLTLPEYSERRAILEFTRYRTELQFVITDEGQGFNWLDYLEISPQRAFDTHGRGIAMARMLSFDHLQYQGVGNQVTATVKL